MTLFKLCFSPISPLILVFLIFLNCGFVASKLSEELYWCYVSVAHAFHGLSLSIFVPVPASFTSSGSFSAVYEYRGRPVRIHDPEMVREESVVHINIETPSYKLDRRMLLKIRIFLMTGVLVSNAGS
ncbi:hypothetical protein F5146DRAFT_431370 [Armillaria mellea]|nr:hypothetical protein F5146DRAFT_431370 [Armillaria mellea]